MGLEQLKIDLSDTDFDSSRVQFFLTLHRNDYEIKHINNVSFQSMDILLPVKLNPKTTVKLSFYSGDLNFFIKGMVQTCLLEFKQHDQPHDSHLYRVKILFYPENGELNQIFFMAVRKYLDKFDAQFPLE